MSDNSKSQLLICSEEVFDRYFQYDNYEGDLPNHLIVSIINSMRQPEKLKEILQPFFRTGDLRRILIELRARAGHAFDKKSYAIDFIALCLEMSDQFIEDDFSRLETPIRFLATNAIEEYLIDFDANFRANVIWSAVSRSRGVAGFIMTVAIWKSESEKEQSKTPFVEKAELKDFISSARKIGLRWIKEDNSLVHPQFKTLLQAIKNISEKSYFLSALMVLLHRSQENYKMFLCNFLTPLEKGNYKFEFKWAASIIDLKELIQMGLDKKIAFSDSEDRRFELAWSLLSKGLDDYLRTGDEEE